MQFLARLFPFFVRNAGPQLKCSFFICKKRLKSAESSLTTQKTNMTMESSTIWRCISYQKNGGFVSLCHVRNFRGEVPHPSLTPTDWGLCWIVCCWKDCGESCGDVCKLRRIRVPRVESSENQRLSNLNLFCPFCPFGQGKKSYISKHPFFGFHVSFFVGCIEYGFFWDFGT